MLSFYTYTLFKYVPSDFPSNSRFVIAENETLKSVSVRLKEEKYITSDLFFRALISSAGKDRMLKAGGYSFNEPLNLLNVVKKFSFGKPDVPLLSITIPEGSTVDEIAESVHKVIPTISVDSFLRFVEETKVHGKLFPSTYFLSPSSTAEGIIKIMKNTFENKYMHFVQEVSLPSPLSSHEEVLSLAAILEGEAKTKEDMQMVAGILLSRLQKGMLLQVDVATSTYTIKGLPTVPINNPGEISILAVFNATPSPYLYYLTGKDGKMYYAKTFEEHKRNIQKYLR
ncbi:MAG: endolytic transglycosylase MltG [Candidatus Pacebacteria bacterium]|nr:endolytic transglycosylase MltG [Candidatus Paceibacterota bacterium]